MKKLVLLTMFIIVLAVGFQTQAAVPSLPIGSVEKVLKQYLEHTYQIGIYINAADSMAEFDNNQSVQLFGWACTSYAKSDGTVETVKSLCERSALLKDKTELEALIGNLLQTAVNATVEPSNPALQGKIILLTVCGGWQPGAFMEGYSRTFLFEKDFTLDFQGIPTNTYEVDMNSITKGKGQAIFIDGDDVVTGGEIRDSQGNFIGKVLIQSWATNALVFHDEVLTGQPGTVSLQFASGTNQIFNLADGSPLSPPILPALSISPVIQKSTPLSLASGGVQSSNLGVKVTVAGPPGKITVEYTENFKDWQVLTVLTNSTGSVSTVDTATNGARFYRARFGD